jgi:type IV secretory pathway VirB2 component (pilin)
MGVIYCLFLAARLTILDVGFHSKYDRFVKWVLGIVGVLVSAFFIAHLTLFYPKLLP